jgi:tetratricopeptide (TPR) repeat protein
MRRDGGGIRFRRYQLDHQGAEINVFEQDVDWVLGSGHRSRTYLFRTPGDELYQLPIAWYTQEAAWGMAPGFDRPDHQGVGRRVQRECMFCHNAYPDVPAGSDDYLRPQLFPAELPHGIGCQRCHGPGAEHVRRGLADAVDFKALAASIVNPAELGRERRREVCYQCHLQPSVALMGVRRFGRGVYSYRPGEPLADYLVQIDVEEEGVERGERFEINHHPYRLEQSACFQKSGGELSCLTCHDPHRKVPVAERPAHYRRACLGCHRLDDCDLEAMASASAAGTVELPRGVALDDCAGCHMSQRRSRDVVHAVMTDHLIRRRPGGEELLAPLEESTPVIVGARLTDPDGPQGALGEVYRAVAVLRAGGSPEAVVWLEKKLAEARPEELEPYLDLGRWQLEQQRPQAAAATAARLRERHPGDAVVTGLLAAAKAELGEPEAALALAREALELDPTRPEAHYNLGQLLLAQQGPAAALPHLRRAVELRPHFAAGWYRLSFALERLGRRDQVLDGLRRALAAEPSFREAYKTLASLLFREGEDAEAIRYLRHARSLASAGASRGSAAGSE